MPAVNETVILEGWRELYRANELAQRQIVRDLKPRMRELAEPVRAEAEQLAASGIPKIGLPWSRMRVGVTQSSVYVAPRQRGSRIPGRRRPNLAGLLLGRAMVPALAQNRPRVIAGVERLLDDIAEDWGRLG